MTVTLDHDAIAAEALPQPALFIGDQRITETASGFRERMNPATGKLLGLFPVAGAEEVDAAVKAAWKAFPAWKRLGADKRRELLYAMAQTIRDHDDELRRINALETGTPISSVTFNMAIDHLQYYAGWTDKFEGELVSSYPRPAFDYVKYEPFGVVGALITWNGPVINTCMKLAPALAAGNCVVLKSPDLGPFAMMRLTELFLEAGLPAGVVNLLSGDRHTTQAIVNHPDVRKVSFTGGPTVAKALLELAAKSLTPMTMELGGKSANIVFEDADLDKAVQMGAFMSTIASSGQGCLYPTRMLVHDSIYDEVVERVAAVAGSVTPGDPLDPDTVMGPVINEDAVDRILGIIDRAKQTPARLIAGGERLDGELAGGCYLPPTVFADVDGDSELEQEEVFGPVLAISRFSTEEEAITRANSTEYGLAAYLHTRDLARAHRMADELDAGWIGVNCFPAMAASAPFGGVKQSGFGREGGRAGIEEFVHHKNVYIPLD